VVDVDGGVVSKLIQRHDLRDRVQPALLFDGKTDAGPSTRQVREKGLSGMVAATRLSLCIVPISNHIQPLNRLSDRSSDKNRRHWNRVVVSVGSFIFVQYMPKCFYHPKSRPTAR